MNQPTQLCNELNDFVTLLTEKFSPLKIYLFSKNVKTINSGGCFVNETKKEEIQYFLLMVMEPPTRNEHEAQDFCNNRFKNGKITILSHSLATIIESTEKNNRFFTSILNTGILLYNRSGLMDQVDRTTFDPAQSYEKAQKHFFHRTDLANAFLEAASESFSNDHFSVCVFLVHQVIEQCTISLIRVHLAYRSDIHHLGRQMDLCQCFSDEPSAIFRSNHEDLRLFGILTRSYSEARYKDSFKVEQNDADKILSKGYAFYKLTKKMCYIKIAEFKKFCIMTESEVGFE